MADEIKEIIQRNLLPEDYAVSATALMAKQYLATLSVIPRPVKNLLDLGCAYGGVALAASEYLGTNKIHGIDINCDRLEVCLHRGFSRVNLHDLNCPLPYEDNCFSVITCNGVIEHLNWYDDIITEVKRVLIPGGYFIVTWPNLANYIQRFALMRGYQPTDVCISKKIYAGTMYDAGSKDPERHMRSCTSAAMRQLLDYYGFEIISLVGADPVITGKYAKWAPMLKVVGKIVPDTLARRLIVIARKP